MRSPETDALLVALDIAKVRMGLEHLVVILIFQVKIAWPARFPAGGVTSNILLNSYKPKDRPSGGLLSFQLAVSRV
jgi:hypothetical protein